MQCRCSSREGAQIIISSKYARQCVEVSSLSARLINLEKLAGPFVSPKKRVCPLLLLPSADTETPNPDRKSIGHHPALPRHHRSSLTILHLSMYTNSVCSNQCTYANFHHVSLPKQPDCSRGSATLQFYHSPAAWSPSGNGSILTPVLMSCSIRSNYLKSELFIGNMPTYWSISRENCLFCSSESPSELGWITFALLFSLSVLSCLSSSIFLSITKQHVWLGGDGLPPISVGVALQLTPLTEWYSATGRGDRKPYLS